MTRATTPSQIKGDDAIVTRETTPSQQRQGRLRIDNGNDTIIMRQQLLWRRLQRRLRINGDNAIMMEGDDASLSTSDEGDDASSTMVETHLRINDSDDAIMKRAIIVIVTMETPAHQWR
jgi:hypothetical protein